MKKVIKKLIPNLMLNHYFHIKKWIVKKIRRIPKNEIVNFDSSTISDGHFHVSYRGVSSIRCPFDYVMYQMLIFKVKPDLVIEIGTNHGGGALYIADIMDKIGHGTVHTIDIVERADILVRNHPRIKLFTGGWEKYDVNNVRNFAKILVIEDASHMYEDSLGALHKFSPLVSPGSYFIVEDGIVSELGRQDGFNGGPLRAIREFLGTNDKFAVDRTYCDMFGKNATFNVNGYLKRIK